jgi:PAS domain S-box-containing protein
MGVCGEATRKLRGHVRARSDGGPVIARVGSIRRIVRHVTRSFSSFRVRLVLLVLVGAVPALTLTLRTTFEWRRYQVREVREEALSLARLVAGNQERTIAAGRQGLLGLSRFSAERFQDPSECQRLLSAHWSDLAGYELLGVATHRGRALCTVRAGDDDMNLAGRHQIRQTSAAGERGTDDHIDVTPGRATMRLAQPVLDTAGRPTAIAFASVNVGGLGAMAAGEKPSEGTTVTLIDGKGTIIGREPDPGLWVGRSALGAAVFRSILGQREEGTAEAVDVDGMLRVFAFRPLSGLAPTEHVHVVIGVEPAVAFADGDRIIRRSLIELGLVAGLALAAAWVGTDVFLVRQTKTLVATARRLTLGDLGARTGIQRGSGELCELSRAFDEMAAALEARQAETERAREALRGAHEELEDRVRSRTAELVEANAALEQALAERERAEEARRKLSSAVEQAADSVMIANREGVIEYVNPAFERLTGYTAQEAIGQTGRILKSGVHDEPFYRELWRTIAAGEVFRAVLVNRKKAGEHYYEEKIITPLRDGQGAISHFVSAGRDITERKRAEEQLRSSREELRALAAHLESVREDERSRIAREIHDELGQALTALRFDVRRLGGSPPDDRQVALERMQAMTALIDGTIASVRRIATELRPGVLDDLGLGAAIEWQAQEFEARTGIRCSVTMTPTEVDLSREVSTAVFRIFQETLTNVARHANAHDVEIALSAAVDHVALVVRDDGRGITEAELAGRRSLGLLGMRERALLLGGDVTIQGQPGQGTTVMLQVPLEQGRPIAPRSAVTGRS